MISPYYILESNILINERRFGKTNIPIPRQYKTKSYKKKYYASTQLDFRQFCSLFFNF